MLVVSIDQNILNSTSSIIPRTQLVFHIYFFASKHDQFQIMLGYKKNPTISWFAWLHH
jgi:hypothetical protein